MSAASLIDPVTGKAYSLANPLPFLQAGNTAIATAQVSVGTTATQIAALRAGRGSVTIENEGTTAVRIGIAGVTTGNGFLLPGVVGASLTLQTTAAVFGIVAAGTQTVSVLETF
jgi:hypothetical protein